MKKRLRYAILASVLAGLAVVCLGAAAFFIDESPPLPSFEKVRLERTCSDAVLLDRHGRVIHELRLDPGGRRLEWTALPDISPCLVETVIRAEDRRFYEHGGVDWRALAGSLVRKATGRPARGASTVTMQLAASFRQDIRPRSARRTLTQKWRQMKAARRLEQTWTKREILEAYLNLITFRGEVQGIAAAARGYFGKHPSGLDEAESAILAALIPSPHASPDQIAHRAFVLAQAHGAHISPEAMRALVHERIGRPYRIEPQVALAPHVAKMLLTAKGMRVASTLDGRLQAQVTDILNRRLGELAGRNVHDGAVIVIENRTGEILAYVGNSGSSSSAPYVDGIRALRQAGSTLKPFLYGLAIEGRLLTAASVVEDAPLQIPTPTGLYIPENYTNDYQGLVSVRTALASSLNTPAVRTLQLVGLAPFVERLKALGFTSIHKEPDYYGFSLALGSIDISLQDLAGAFRTLANGGVWSPPTLIPLGRAKAPSRRVLDGGAAFIVGDILSDREARRTVFGLENSLATRFWTAAKTGTSKDMRDNWCAGYSERYTVAVWIGNFSGEPMWNVTGVSGAAPVWFDVMNLLHANGRSRAPAPPAGVVARKVAYADGSEANRSDWFLKGTEPGPVISAETRHAKATIVNPAAGSIVTIDPDIPDNNQQIALRADPAGRKYVWLLDRTPLSPEARESLLWRPVRGNHVLAIADEGGHVLDSVPFVVR